MKIDIQATVNADIESIWKAWNDPEDIKRWNAASDDWHTTHSTVDLREGGTFLSRMEAKDGSFGFDFGGTYTRIEPHKLIEYRMGDAREVRVEFIDDGAAVLIKSAFDAESTNPAEMQRAGWQAILDNFVRYVERKHKAG